MLDTVKSTVYKRSKSFCIFFAAIFLNVFFITLSLPVISFHEIPEGRPLSVYSLCCCKKETENYREVIYRCKYTDDYSCPGNTQKYDVSVSDCPSDLIFSKYKEEE